MSALHIFTIGHSNHPIGRFIDLLRRNGIQAVADVRSTPASSRNPHYNREAIKATLVAEGIKYIFLGKELGARRAERGAYEGKVATYERIAQLPAFRDGLERLKEGARTYRIALMCAEKDPLDCHRTLLVCRHLRSEFPGHIEHILADGNLESHAEAERRLISDMGMNMDQSDMFSGDVEPPLERAYRKRGLAIAYQEESGSGS